MCRWCHASSFSGGLTPLVCCCIAVIRAKAADAAVKASSFFVFDDAPLPLLLSLFFPFPLPLSPLPLLLSLSSLPLTHAPSHSLTLPLSSLLPYRLPWVNDCRQAVWASWRNVRLELSDTIISWGTMLRDDRRCYVRFETEVRCANR